MTLYAVGSAHVTKEELQSGKFSFDFELEDTVYIQLHPLEVETQRHQPQRPVNNEYLFSVSPAARRWYELLAPAIFGVTNNAGPGYCEILYSWYVERHHTLKRQTERWQAAKQMDRLIKDHIAFGYVSRVEYIEVREPGKEVDFCIRYYPGGGARESTKRIRSRIGKRNAGQLEVSQPTGQTQSSAQKSTPTSTNHPPALTDEQAELTRRLLEHGVHADTATELVSAEPDEVERQLEYLPYRTVKKNKGGLLRKAVIERWSAPDEYLEVKKREHEQQDAQERLKRKRAEATAAEEQKTREEALKRAYFDFLKPKRRSQKPCNRSKTMNLKSVLP